VHETLGNRIRAAREAKGLSLRDLARRVQLDYGYLSKIENGAVSPSAEALSALAEVLELDEIELLLLGDRVPAPLDPLARSEEALDFFKRAAAIREPAEWRELSRFLEERLRPRQ